MKQRGSNTGYGSQHLGKERSQVAKAPLPRLLPLPWSEVCSLEGILGLRRASPASSLGISLSSLRGRQPGMYRVQREGTEAALQVSPVNRERVPQGNSGSRRPSDSSVYALRHAQCSTSRRRVARSDAQLSLLRGPDRRREVLLGELGYRGNGTAAQGRGVGIEIQREQG